MNLHTHHNHPTHQPGHEKQAKPKPAELDEDEMPEKVQDVRTLPRKANHRNTLQIQLLCRNVPDKTPLAAVARLGVSEPAEPGCQLTLTWQESMPEQQSQKVAVLLADKM